MATRNLRITYGFINLGLHLRVRRSQLRLHTRPSVSHAQPTSQSKVYEQYPAYSSGSSYFKIDFPSTPTVSNGALDMRSGNPSLPYVEYLGSINHGSNIFQVLVYSWPEEDSNFTDTPESVLRVTLGNCISEEVQNNHGTLVNTKELHVFAGQTLAEEAQFTMQDQDHTLAAYVRVFVIGNTEYDILSENTDEIAFENFANSFQYTGPFTFLGAVAD